MQPAAIGVMVAGMMRWCLLGLALSCQLSVLAHDKRVTVSLERLWGFERYVLDAAAEMRFPVPLLGPGAQGDYEVYLTPLFRSALHQKMYRKSTGRMEDSVLELYDPRTGQTRVRHTFQLRRDAGVSRREAREFLDRTKRSLTAP